MSSPCREHDGVMFVWCYRICCILLLQALESFVARSPNDARPFLDQLLSEGLKNLKYDPNYAVDDMDEDEEEAGEQVTALRLYSCSAALNMFPSRLRADI